jgi:1,2-dihydroxy-3-keto-5-methylthiopentene dioxygenase
VGSFEDVAARLAEVGRFFHARGWVLGSSGNMSAVLSRDPLRIAITASGRDKGSLGQEHFIEIDERGSVVAGAGRPSDETPLHLAIVADGAPAEEILAAYGGEIAELKQRGGYVTADVIDVKPETPGLDAMLAKFSREHWHDEDEVRFIIEGSGVFHIHPRNGPVCAIEVVAGDLIRVPRGTWHWFDLCADRRIRAIRLFQDPAGWTPRYTDSGVDRGFEPVCLGPAHIAGDAGRA